MGGQMARVGYSDCDSPAYYNKFQVYDVPASTQEVQPVQPVQSGGRKKSSKTSKRSTKKSKKSSKRSKKSSKRSKKSMKRK
jgi:hypothetical protein